MSKVQVKIPKGSELLVIDVIQLFDLDLHHITKLKPEVLNWLEQNDITVEDSFLLMKNILLFDNEQDALLFKLRWI